MFTIKDGFEFGEFARSANMTSGNIQGACLSRPLATLNREPL